MPCSIKVKFGSDHELEAIGETIAVVSFLVNESTKKFFPNTKWTSYEMSK